MNRFLYIVALLIAAAISSVNSQDMPISTDLQAALFKKILSFDKKISAGARVIIVYSEASGGVQSKAAAAFSSAGFSVSSAKADQLAGSIGSADAAYFCPGVTPPHALCAKNGVLTITGVPAFVENGAASVGIGTEGGKPKILVNTKQLKAEKHELGAELLKMAKIFQ